MRRNKRLLVTITILLGVLAGQIQVAAETASAPSLIISQLKITSSNGQFITLYNATNSPLDMSKYQLEYFNSYDLSKATSSKLISLTGTLPPHDYYIVNDSALLLCYQLMVDSVSLGLSSTAGMVEVLAFNQSAPGGSATPVLQDYVGWSKTAASGAQTLPANLNAFLQRQPLDKQNNPLISTPGSGTWQSVQPDAGNPCNLISTNTIPAPVANGLSLLLPSTEPPATIITLVDDSGQPSPTGLPASDIGLMAPQITELLPNPNGTGNDSSDEFIELYNPNAVSFDLSGFTLQTGISSLHTYTFPADTKLPSHAFVAFYSETTKLTLSNTDSQAKLLDPFGNSISATAAYNSAKDGQAWALAKGKWYWTTSPTPNAANIVKQPATKKSGSKKSKSTAKSGAKSKGAKTSKNKNLGGASNAYDDAATTPINFKVLAVVAGLALLYGAYEYRTDLANRIYQFRRYLETRRANRLETSGRRDD